MRTSLIILMAAGLLMIPFAVFSSAYAEGSPVNGGAPPVAQVLVREGDFSIKLAAAFQLGVPSSEAEAENTLARIGIVPSNGWISDYPVTPEILGQIQAAAAEAASNGSLPMTADEAKGKVEALAAQMSLAVPAAGQQAPESGVTPDQAVIEGYYADEGPPIITYYPPPLAYGYLYDWVPYPVWWYDVWFPGFYICHSFSTVVVVHSGPAVVTNHFVDRVSGRVVRMSPYIRSDGGVRRPVTALRTEDGRTFRTLGEMRTWTARHRNEFPVRRPAFTNATPPVRGYTSSRERRSAGIIYGRSIERSREQGRNPATYGAVRRNGGGATSRSGQRRFLTPSSAVRRPAGTPTFRRERPFTAGPVNSGQRYHGRSAYREQRAVAPVPRGDRFITHQPRRLSPVMRNSDRERGNSYRFFGRAGGPSWHGNGGWEHGGWEHRGR